MQNGSLASANGVGATQRPAEPASPCQAVPDQPGITAWGHPAASNTQPSSILSACRLQSLELRAHRHNRLPSGPTAAAEECFPLLKALCTIVSHVTTNFAAKENADEYMACISNLANSWASLAPAAAQLEEYQRAAGFSHLLTAAEMHQLCLLLQRKAAEDLAAKAQSEQQALVPWRTALAASRQLCELQPGSAAYLLLLAGALSGFTSKGTQQELGAYRAALQAATVERGEAGGNEACECPDGAPQPSCCCCQSA